MDLHSVRTLAHRLYCQCQDQPNQYRSLARSVKALRNELEDADEVLVGTTFGPEDIRVLEIAGESKHALNKLDYALQRNADAESNSTTEPTVAVADFIAEFAVVTYKLSEAIKDLEQAEPKADLLLTENRRGHRRKLSNSTASIESVSRDTSFRSSATSNTSYESSKSMSEPAKMPAIVEQKVFRSSSPAVLERRMPPLILEPLQNIDQTIPHSPVRLPAVPPSVSHGSALPSSAVDHQCLSPLHQLPARPWSARPSTHDSRHGGSAALTGSLIAARTDRNQLGDRIALHPPSLHTGWRRFSDGHMQPSPSHSTSSYSAEQIQQYATRPLPARPRTSIADQDTGLPLPSELPGEQINTMVQNAHRPLQLTPPRAAYRLFPKQSHAEQTHPASRADHVRPPIRWRGSGSSETLPTVMRVDSKFLALETMHSRSAHINEDDVRRTIDSWNNSDWSTAELCLKNLLNIALGMQNHDIIRRLHHLLGAVTSIQGRWQQALTHFLMVLRKPMMDDAHLDDGDCSAAYWLGDLYCMLNRRAEALVAYMIAEHSSLLRGTQLRQRILAEQKGCFPASAPASQDEWSRGWELEAKKCDRSSSDSLLNPQVLSSTAESLFLGRARLRAAAKKDSKQHNLDQNHSRVMAFRVLGADAGSYQLDYRLRICSSAFDIKGSWPLMFDPHFAIANVLRGRFLNHEGDLLSLVRIDHSADVPKAKRGWKAHFTSRDLPWLIANIRECLTFADMTFSEVASPRECFGFVARFAATEKQIASVHFLTISIFKQAFKSGYSVDIASDGLYSARIVRGDWLYDKGVPCKETERIRAMILEHLEVAAKFRGPMRVVEDTGVQIPDRSPRKRGLFASARSSMSSARPSLSSVSARPSEPY